MDIREFDKLLLATTNEEERLDFIRKYFFHGTPFVFDGREHEYFEFRGRISKYFNIGFHEVFIVGSGKLGFSHIKKTEFSYESDIDVVLVNEGLFEHFQERICDYQYMFDTRPPNISVNEKKAYRNFLQYLVKGWMRPDLLPVSFQMDILKEDWFEFFKSISFNNSEVGNYKVAGGLYRNYKYLEKYYTSNIESYFNELKMRSELV